MVIKKTRREQSIETKNKIIEASMQLFSQYEYKDVKIQDICDKAEVSIGAFYHYFESKEAVLNAGHIEFDSFIDEILEAGEYKTTNEELYALIETQMEYVVEHGYLATLQVYKNQLTINAKYVLNDSRRYNTLLKDIINRGIESGEFISELTSKEIVNIILVITRGMIYSWCLNEGKFDLALGTLKMLANIFPWFWQEANRKTME